MFSRKTNAPLAKEDPASPDSIEAGRLPCRKLWLLIGAISLAALGIGLGVGLGLGLSGGSDDDSNNGGSGAGNSNSTTPAFPMPTGNVTNRTFWQPAVNSTWQIILLNPIELGANATATTPDVEVFDIDLFTNTQSTITKLHSLGKKVICYFSAGSYEPGRPDSSEFQKSDLGSELDGWPGEYWLQIMSPDVRKIMAARIKLASEQGCDAIDPDNVDGYSNKNGLGLTEADSINYMQFLSSQAGQYNMSCGLKNAGDILPDVLNITHFSVNEQCVQYDECTTFAPFIEQSKPVFHIEYPDGTDTTLNGTESFALKEINYYCGDSGNSANSTDFSTVLKNMNLDGWVEYCNTGVFTTPTNTSSS